MKTVFVFTLVLTAHLVAVSTDLLAQPSTSTGAYQVDKIGGTDEDAGKAITTPDKYAWELFAALNQASQEGDGTVVWENWGLARLVYDDPELAPGDLEQRWHDGTIRRPATGKREDRFEALPIQQQILRAAREETLGHPLSRRRVQQLPFQQPGAVVFDPKLAGLGDGPPENDEVRMNWSAFKTVVDNELYSVDGQEAAFESGRPLSFEPDAKEIKAEWRRLAVLPAEPQARRHQLEQLQRSYHTAVFGDEAWGLIALHITTKDLPNWFWATWEHESTRQREAVVPSRDRWGAKLENGEDSFNVYDRISGNEKGDPYPDGRWIGPSDKLLQLFQQTNLTEEKWKHYVLRGTQIDFTDKFGRPTILANSVIEEGFQGTSSCITCHAKAGIGPRMRRSDEKSRLPVFASDDPPVGDIGLPKSEWFFGSRTVPSNRNYLQFDFVWSTIRAKRKGGTDADQTTASNHPLVGKWTYRALMNSEQEVKDPDVGSVTLGTGVLEIAEVDEFGRLKGTLSINESTTPDKPWLLSVSGTASFDNHRWSLEFEAKGMSRENDGGAESGGNRWHYEYEASSFKSSMKFIDAASENGRVPVFAGRVTRVAKHPTGQAAQKLRDPNSGVTLKDLDPIKDFYPAGFTGTFQMVKQSRQ